MAKAPKRIFVVPITGRETDIKKLRQLVNQAGCISICDEAPPADYEKCLADADVLVILICPETMDDPSANALITSARRAGKRIVGVWSPDSKDPTLPAVLHKHGEAVIVFDVQSIKQAVCDGQAIWLTPEGKARPTPKTPRHKG